jgi:hypothetical protein
MPKDGKISVVGRSRVSRYNYELVQTIAPKPALPNIGFSLTSRFGNGARPASHRWLAALKRDRCAIMGHRNKIGLLLP